MAAVLFSPAALALSLVMTFRFGRGLLLPYVRARSGYRPGSAECWSRVATRSRLQCNSHRRTAVHAEQDGPCHQGWSTAAPPFVTTPSAVGSRASSVWPSIRRSEKQLSTCMRRQTRPCNHISRFTASGGAAAPSSERVIFLVASAAPPITTAAPSFGPDSKHSGRWRVRTASRAIVQHSLRVPHQWNGSSRSTTPSIDDDGSNRAIWRGDSAIPSPSRSIESPTRSS
jgi:hypothetical protein